MAAAKSCDLQLSPAKGLCQMKRNLRLPVSLLTAFLCWLFYSLTSELYLYTDNFDVALILNGFFGSPLSQYQHPFFCLFVNLLSKLMPFADMFTLTVHILIFIELFLLVYLLPEPFWNKEKREINDWLILIITILFCVFLSAGLNLWRANYTIQAASLLFTGWLIPVMKKDRTHIAISTVLIAFGTMIRKEAALLFIPFLALLLFLEGFTAKKEERKVSLQKYMPTILVSALLLISQAALNLIEPFAEAKRYNTARTALVDFPVKPWSEDVSFSGIAREDYEAAQNWLFSDTEIMTADLLEKMAGAGSLNFFDLSGKGFETALMDMRRIIWKTDVYMSVMAVFCILAALWNTAFQKAAILKLLSLCTIFGAFLILLFFTVLGRAPLRVWQPVLFAVMTVQISLFLKGESWIGHTAQSFSLLLLSALLYYSAGQVIAHVRWLGFKTCLTSRINMDDSAYLDTFEDNTLYIWPSWHGGTLKYLSGLNKLPTQRVIEHNIALGDWTSGQPYYTDFLKRIGHSNPIKDLVEGNNTFIMSDSDYILDYLRFHYGEDIALTACGTVNDTTAYKVTRSW